MSYYNEFEKTLLGKTLTRAERIGDEIFLSTASGEEYVLRYEPD